MFLGMSPIDDKLDIWWQDVDSTTKEQAQVLGWSSDKWDDDWAIHDLPCEHWNWDDMSAEQKRAAQHFGYSKSTWDETDDDDEEDFVPAAASKPEHPKHSKKTKKNEEETDDLNDDEEKKTSQSKDDKKAKKKDMLTVTKFFGGEGGDSFDHRNNRSITEITVHADSHVVNGIDVKYFGNLNKEEGKKSGKAHTLTLGKDEYITSVSVRSNKLVQSLEFKTNKGNTLGPAGGSGWKLPGKDHAGELVTLPAPAGCQLCGLSGRAGACLDAIAFRWGPVPSSMQ